MAKYKPVSGSRADRAYTYLLRHGPQKATELSAAIGVKSRHIASILRAPIRAGAVSIIGYGVERKYCASDIFVLADGVVRGNVSCAKPNVPASIWKYADSFT